MKSALYGLMFLCALLGGCEPGAPKVSDDIPRLKAIDARFTAGELSYSLEEFAKYTKEYPSCYQGVVPAWMGSCEA